MRRSFLVILMLLLACSFATAADYIGINLDATGSVYEGTTQNLEFRLTYECGSPSPLGAVSLGFTISSSGATTFDHAAGSVVKLHDTDWFTLGGLQVNATALVGTGLTSGQILFGGANLPGSGIPTGTVDEPFVQVPIQLSSGFPGLFCIDSAFVPPAGTWKFSGMTCGDEADASRPDFVDINGSNAEHPICVDVEELSCIPPTIGAGPAGNLLVANHCNSAGFQFSTTDNGGLPGDPSGPVAWAVISGIGTIDGNGAYSASGPANGVGVFAVTIEATNDCGGTDTYSFDVQFTNNAPSFVGCPLAGGASTNSDFSIAFNANDPDPCDGLTFSIIDDGGFPGDVSIVGNEFVWNPTAGTAGVYTFIIGVEDPWGGTATCEINVELSEGAPIQVVIEKEEGGDVDGWAYRGVVQGHYVNVSVSVAAADYNQIGDIGGFDLLIAYDASALTFIEALPGYELVQDGWEYFTYRFGPFGNCGGACPSGMLRVVAMAELNNGPAHPVDFQIGTGLPVGNNSGPGEIVDLKFYVTNDRTYECQFVPIYFWWFDCGDNTFSNKDGDRLFIGDNVFNFYDWSSGAQNYQLRDESQGGDYKLVGDFEFYTVPNDCLNPIPDKPDAEPIIDFFNGGVDIVCADDIDARGDLNLNEIANEIADAVLYTNYFIYGLSVFTINMDGQIAASDVNNDGRVLTVGDLVYLVRIVTGDALPIPKLSPFANSVEFVNANGTIQANGSDLGAALFVFDVNGDVNVKLLADGMKVINDVVDGQLRVLVYSTNENSIANHSNVIAVEGNATLVSAEAADYYGNDLTTNIAAKVLPTSYALKQNFPNPFNPSTAITIVLPEAGQYKIDIYNVAGQLVKSVTGYGVGEVTEIVDFSNEASGIYFYKATAGQFTDTKKMVLMK